MGRLNKSNITRGLGYLKRNGIRQTVYKAAERILRDKDEIDYDALMRENQAGEEELRIQRERVFSTECKISILVPLYETDEELMIKMLESVAAQTYGNWELCLADASKSDSRRNLVKEFCEKWNLKCTDRFGNIYDKVKYVFLNSNYGISGNTNKALEMAGGDYIGLLDHDDILEPNALYEFMLKFEEQSPDILRPDKESARVLVWYSDEDKITGDGSKYFDYHKKPDFNPILLCSNNYICHFLIVDTNLARSVGGFHSEYDGAQDHDFILRCTEGIKREQIVHNAKVLYHWRSTESSTAENPNAKLYAYRAGKKAVTDHLLRMGISAKVSDTAHLGFYRLDYPARNDKVILISYEDYCSMTNDDIENIDSEFIMILSSTLHPVHKDYITGLLGCMSHDSVGAVTGRIIGRGSKTESAGYDINDEGVYLPRFSGLYRHFSGYLHRASIQQNVDGFSGECVLIRKKAVKTFAPGIVLEKGYDIYYEPNEEFKR